MLFINEMLHDRKEKYTKLNTNLGTSFEYAVTMLNSYSK